MNTKRNITIAIATALGIALVLNTGVLAQGPGHPLGPGPMMGGQGDGAHRTMAYGQHRAEAGHSTDSVGFGCWT